MNKKHLLIVDDDNRLRELLHKFLTDKGFLVTTAEDAETAFEYLKFFSFDLAILDVMMPGENGYELTQRIRQGPVTIKNLPILMLTAMGEIDNKIEGLSHGVDDYLTKPFDPRELLLRIQSVLRRTRSEEPLSTLHMGDVTFNIQQNLLMKEGILIPLTSSETQLLKVLAHHAGETLSREDLMDACDGDFNPRTIDVQITRLRRKIEESPKSPRYLQTVRGKGYTLIPESS